MLEALLFVPLLILHQMGYLAMKYIILLMGIIYWLPKILINAVDAIMGGRVLMQKSLPSNIPLQNNHYLALTFDDLPYGYHRQLIDTLDKYQMKATFFVISGQITSMHQLEIFVKAVQNGHQLANHGKINSMHFLKNETSLGKEINDCDEMIKTIYRMANVSLPKQMFYRPGCGL